MSTYASQADVTNYIEGWVTDDAFALERLIQRSERDVDRVLRSSRRSLPPTQVITLQGATTGTIVLDWNGPTPGVTSSLAFNESGAAMQAALQSLPGLGTNVNVVGDYPVWTVSFNSTWAGGFTHLDIPKLVVDVSSTNGLASVEFVAGRKIDPVNDLDANQAEMLSNAVCAQVEYRNAMGQNFFVRPQYRSVRGPDFSTQGILPRVAPKVLDELTNSGLLLTTGRAVIGRRHGLGRATH